MFADMELIGVPQRIVIGERGLQNNMVEYQARTEAESVPVAVTEIVDFIKQKLKK
jgi:prolyl-tRNA synthetase